MKDLSKNFSTNEILKLFKKLDKDDSHSISEEEFMSMIQNNFKNFKKTLSFMRE